MTRSNELFEQGGGSWAYRAGVCVALFASLLTIWTTIVRDDGNGIGFLMLVMAAAVGAFSARFRSQGMARAMLGVAIMQGLLGIAVATAPPTEAMPNGSVKALLFSGFFAALWLFSGALFGVASKRDEVSKDDAD